LSAFLFSLRKRFGFETKSSLAAPEPWLSELFGVTPSSAGIAVTPRIAMTCAPVRAAVQAISEACGQLPVHVYQRSEDGAKERHTDHPSYKLLHDEANEWTPASKFREEITRDALLYPNGGFAFINRVDGKPIELTRFDPEVEPVTVSYENREPVYSIPQKAGPPRKIARENILHIPSPSLNGRGLVQEGKEAIGLALIMERYAARLFGNGARPSGVISFKGLVTPEALSKARDAWRAAHGGDKSGGTAVLPGDAEWQPITLTSVDAQFLELRTFAIAEIARIFRVPPHMLFEMGRATWGNSTNMREEFLMLCLMAWVKRWEGEIRLKLFTEEERKTYFAEFLTDDFARSDLSSRMEAYSKAISARILNPNEVRAAENRPPYDGGDKFENPNTSQGATQ
jgi:HK97 family phage portal protein